jgi:hypothetical protein
MVQLFDYKKRYQIEAKALAGENESNPQSDVVRFHQSLTLHRRRLGCRCQCHQYKEISPPLHDLLLVSLGHTQYQEDGAFIAP